jgi:hypothetical protein
MPDEAVAETAAPVVSGIIAEAGARAAKGESLAEPGIATDDLARDELATDAPPAEEPGAEAAAEIEPPAEPLAEELAEEPAEQEGEGGESEETEPPEAAEPDPELVVRLPGHPERGEDDIEFVAPDKETAARFNRLLNDGMRGTEYRERIGAVEDREEQINTFVDELEHDPIGFLMEEATPELQVNMAKHLLTNPLVYDALYEMMYRWGEDPSGNSRRADIAEMQAQRGRDHQLAQQRIMDNRAARQNTAQIVAQLESIVPPEMDAAMAQSFVRFCRQRLAEAVRETPGMGMIDPDKVVPYLEDIGVLRHFGIGGAAVSAPANGNGRARPAAEPVSSPAEAARAAGARVGQRIQQRRAAAAVAPPGAGASPTRAGPPPDATVEESLDWFRKSRGIPR